MANLANSNIQRSLGSWLTYHLKDKKLDTPLGWFLMTCWGFAIAYITTQVSYSLTAILLLSLIGIFVLLVCLRYPLAGLYFTIVFSSLYSMPGRLFNMPSPIGLLVEVFTYVLWIAILGRHTDYKDRAATFWKSPITLVYLVIMIYYLVEIANPSMYSLQGWIFFFRKQISYFLFYYICYVAIDSLPKIKAFIKFWVVLVFIIAVYGVKQQWFGLFGFEKAWVASDPLIMQLFFQGGFLRKFSFLTDPASYGVICAVFAIFTLVLAIRITNNKAKAFLYLATIISLMGSAYSGSRTCNLMIVAGLFAYAIFTLNEKRTYVLLVISFFLGVFLLYGPLQYTPVVFRIKTTLQGSKDASASLRDFNRARIQPYVYTHPIGGGLNTAGTEGSAYNPGHTLSTFQSDSGYMKILVEQGWIGFALHLLFYFLILKRGVECFFQARNPYIQNLYVALTVALFSLIVGQYSQIAIAQYPLMLFYFFAIVVIQKLIYYDSSSNPETNVT